MALFLFVLLLILSEDTSKHYRQAGLLVDFLSPRTVWWENVIGLYAYQVPGTRFRVRTYVGTNLVAWSQARGAKS